MSTQPYWTAYAHTRDWIYWFYRPTTWIQDAPAIDELFELEHRTMVRLFGDVPHAFVDVEYVDYPLDSPPQEDRDE